jgi:hypothetical protein
LRPNGLAANALVHAGEQQPERQRVGCADQVHGRAHQVDTHRTPVSDQPGELRGAERAEPGPQPDVGRERRLRLHAAQVLDRLEGRQVRPVQQQLPGQRRPVQ